MKYSHGNLQQVNLKELWEKETDFTLWLAKPENLRRLSQALGIDLVSEKTEEHVGKYRADILAKNKKTREYVIIENLFGKSDHKHIGQALTYAAGLSTTSDDPQQTTTVVWIAPRFNKEHLQTITWLNDISSNEYRFYGVELTLYMINKPPYASRFTVVASPDPSSKTKPKSLTDTQRTYLEFWLQFRKYIQQSRSKLQTRKAPKGSWYVIPLGRAGFHISCTVSMRKSRAGCEIYIGHQDSKKAFDLLLKQKKSIENEVGGKLLWQPLPSKDACRIVLYKGNLNISNRKNWKRVDQWLFDKAETFHEVFSEKIKELEL